MLPYIIIDRNILDQNIFLYFSCEREKGLRRENAAAAVYETETRTVAVAKHANGCNAKWVLCVYEMLV